jgi:hypothetical protein
MPALKAVPPNCAEHLSLNNLQLSFNSYHQIPAKAGRVKDLLVFNQFNKVRANTTIGICSLHEQVI